ncbi:uncharacterized protein LOC116688083 [Etheostoma spectabile]|uniref:uncharacterized protein LOC116688083 n=1 Tax=Etheostoma spectabile TaxID=54343 RepID=UPI0013AF92BF|nr:uncharacterized protein LOC116688083 [Etheostoma spectabile]XP_032369775.1 uncharacterized protein LOC116688083 [Etheostoma spectabile]XP_032369776.1 uncharacterized protein LOC116688083 [Etheostoma spectabile]
MKTLCVAVVVLSLTSVGQPAPLVCEKLLKPADKAPDFPGIWYFIALTSDTCVVTTLLNYVLWPSYSMNITSMNTPNVYNANYRIKTYGYCGTESEDFLFENNTVFDDDVNNFPVIQPEMLLQSGCSDCFIVKRKDKNIDMLMLFSRRQNVSAAELNEFEKQAECLGWAKPEVLNSDHDFENCLDDVDIDNPELLPLIFQRLRNKYEVPFKCMSESAQTFHKAVYEWAQQQWATLW